MKLFNRLMAALASFLSVLGLLVSVAGAVGVWTVKGPITGRATRIFDRVEDGLDLADRGIERVKTSLANAAQRLETIKDEQKKPAQPAGTGGMTRKLLARTVQQQFAPEVGDAQETLRQVAESSVVVNSVLEDLANLPLLSTSGLDVSRLSAVNSRLNEVGPAAWELSRLLEGSDSNSEAAQREVSRIDQALKSMSDYIAGYELQFKKVREEIAGLKARVLFWITPATAIISLMFLWIALSQVSVFFHARSWWRLADDNHF